MQRLLYILPLFLVASAFCQTQTTEEKVIGQSLMRGHQQTLDLLVKANHFFHDDPHSDSALYYISLAKQQATVLDDLPGKASTLLLEADIEGRLKGNLTAMETLSREVVNELSKTSHTRLLASALRMVALASFLQGKEDEGEKQLAEAFRLSQSANDRYGLGWAYYLYGFHNSKNGTYWKSFQNLVESRAIGREISDPLLQAASLFFIARAYNRSGDPGKAIAHYKEALAINKSNFLLLWPHMEDLGMAYLNLKQFDSAIYYQHTHRNQISRLTTDDLLRKRFSYWLLPDFALEAGLEAKQYEQVLSKVLPALPSIRQRKDHLLLLHSLLLAAKAYDGMQKPSSAIIFNREMLELATASSNRNFLEQGYKLQANILRKLKQHDSAWYYLQQHLAIKESIAAEQFDLRTAMYEATAESEKRLALLQKNQLIQQQQLVLKQKELEGKSRLQNLLLAIITGLVLLSVIVVINIFLKRKNEKLESEQKQAALQKKSLQLEMQALRAQMNPHFIFNCLSAIDTLIHTGNADKATVYLSRFARLIRLVLDSLKNNLVPFQKDFETMQLYLELEQFRCNHKFSYSLMADPDLQNGDYKVPPLIAQPFIENAIHHGLLNKSDDNRKLEIMASLVEGQIVYSITDNGIGRRKAAVLKE
ncbi:MAG TPA: histidine kinase, partial [Chitinophagaceae bacterium]